MGNARNGTTVASQLAEGQRGFTGHEHLAELGLIHMNGRIYDPVIGRFLQADPMIQAPHNAQSHNRYSYVLNNPLSFTDPSGFSWWTKWRSNVVAAVTWVATAYFTGCFDCATYLANAVRSGMNAHAAGRPVLRAIGASVVGTFVSLSTGVPMAAAAVETVADGGNIRSALKAAFTAGVSQFGGAALGGCVGAMLNHASCGAGARDAMISAGIDIAQTAAYGYLTSSGNGGQMASKRHPPYDAASRTDRGSTYELSDSCLSGRSGACQALRATNEADLAQARQFLAERYPQLSRFAPAAVTWDDSLEYKEGKDGKAGHVDAWTGAMTLSSRYSNVSQLVDTFAHETVHVYQYATGQAGWMQFLDIVLPITSTGTGYIHDQIYQFGRRAGSEFEVWKQSREK